MNPEQQELLPNHRLFDTAYMVQMLQQKPDAIYRMCTRRVIDHFKMNGRLYFDEEGINKYKERCRIPHKLSTVLLLFGRLAWLLADSGAWQV